MTKRFGLQALLERSRAEEELRLREWIPLERERCVGAHALVRIERAASERCGGFAATDWWQQRATASARAARDAIADVESRRLPADAALRAARLRRRTFEKLEERFARRLRADRLRREANDGDERNAAARSTLQRAP